jgi:hypothetical protein
LTQTIDTSDGLKLKTMMYNTFKEEDPGSTSQIKARIFAFTIHGSHKKVKGRVKQDSPMEKQDGDIGILSESFGSALTLRILINTQGTDT